MSKIVHLSEAVSIGLHGIILVAREKDSLINVQKIAEATGSSKHHVAKILQRLVKAGFLLSHRGPNGGFTLKMAPEKISFLNIVEEIDGKIDISKCPFDHPVCAFSFEKCIVENITQDLSRQFYSYLSNQYLNDYLPS